MRPNMRKSPHGFWKVFNKQGVFNSVQIPNKLQGQMALPSLENTTEESFWIWSWMVFIWFICFDEIPAHEDPNYHTWPVLVFAEEVFFLSHFWLTHYLDLFGESIVYWEYYCTIPFEGP